MARVIGPPLALAYGTAARHHICRVGERCRCRGGQLNRAMQATVHGRRAGRHEQTLQPRGGDHVSVLNQLLADGAAGPVIRYVRYVMRYIV
jgi:hypothetical protein